MSSGYGLGSVFDRGWASPYELEAGRELARNAAAARAEQAAGWQDQMLTAARQQQHELGAAGSAVVPVACSPQCSAGGCQFERAQQMLAQAMAAVETSKRIMRADEMGHRTMSRAMWCDVGQHAYSENDPRAEAWTKRVKDPDAPGGMRELQLDVCGNHVGASPEMRDAIAAKADPA